LAFGRHEDRRPTHGYAATREAAMAASRRARAANRQNLDGYGAAYMLFVRQPCIGHREWGNWTRGCSDVEYVAIAKVEMEIGKDYCDRYAQ
jgi:hypothetical protein